MDKILSFGRFLFAIPFLVFAAFHFMNAKGMSGIVPAYFPAKEILVYLTGLANAGAAISILIGKYDKLATALLGLMLLIFALTIHLPGAGSPDETMAQVSMSSLLKDLMLAGAAWLYARYIAKDNSVIG